MTNMPVPRLGASVAGLLVAVFSWPAWAADAPLPERVDYNLHIRPILSNNCFACHGPDPEHREAGLRLDTADGAAADLGGYAALVPGELDASELYQRITSGDEFEQMPPPELEKPLSPHQIALIGRWIQQGGQYADHWAYTRPVKAEPPPVKDAQWPVTPIDHFVLNRLQQQRLSPAADADPVTLIRRLHFDLVGLPPAPAEVEQFVADRSPDAYERLVDRLLASEHFGERMAMFWLDLVRFADTVGYHGDQDHNISPYRDYVIRAFNDNLPFDQFTIEQLAGDLLPDPTLWQQIATGYNRVLQTSHEGGVQAQEYLTKYSADRVRNASSVWMGATMGCAECHNHKYDPYTLKDFYSFAAFFADIDELDTFKGTDALPTRRSPEIPGWDLPQYRQIRQIERSLAELNEQLQAGCDDQAAVREQIEALSGQREEIQKQFRLTMVTRSVKPRAIRVLPRGNWLDDSGEVVEPAIPAFLGHLETDGRPTRLDLARWLVSPDNPLTARVLVNRLWAKYFGKGLSASLEDFGAQGEAPVHPELLDWLAVEFVESGWDVKRLVKQMVMSRTYRQSSLESPALRQRDPDNRLLARQSRFRLDAELVRDGALAVSGLLVPTVGGHSVRPYQPPGYYQHLNFPKRKYEPHADERQYRRGLYMHWQRVFLHPMLKAFDAPTREECTAERPRSNTPLAALVLMNDPTFVEAARALAVRILQEGGPDLDGRLQWAWRQALSRPPAPTELAVLKQVLQADLQEYRADDEAARRLLQVGLYQPPAELDSAELAAWTSVARTILNLNEMITRN